MLIGTLNKRIEIQAPTRTGDGMGGFNVIFNTIATVFCAIWPVSAKEITALNTTTLEVTHRIRIRYRSVFKASWRIKFGNRYFAIVSVLNPEEKNEWLDIMAKQAA